MNKREHMVWVECGDGSFWIRDWLELWAEMWRAVSYAVFFKKQGHCLCWCDEKECVHCVHECF